MPKKSYSVAAARAKLADIIDDVEAGSEVELIRRGKKVAVLVSPTRYARLVGKSAGFGDAYDAFLRVHDPRKFGVERSFATTLRDKSPGRTVKLG